MHKSPGLVKPRKQKKRPAGSEVIGRAMQERYRETALSCAAVERSPARPMEITAYRYRSLGGRG
ncbi:MAG TPA: hypothetical protein PLZ55_15465, partial [bacterium]|nr:hypothetical protein [bacterium]